ncbi:hypothetical protein CRYUN_Cryun41cG0046000 [Craigia yunnanensis]
MTSTKPCPNCERPIEKIIGCMCVNCRPPCNFEFCWICLKIWDGHWNFYGCNRYSKVIAERRKEKESKRKYLHCWDRWEAHGISRRKAVKDLENLKSQQIKKLGDFKQLVAIQLHFLVEAWKQLIDCRQILRWTYAYGYFYQKTSMNFDEFPKKLIGLTSVTRNYFENLVNALENGVSHVESKPVAA